MRMMEGLDTVPPSEHLCCVERLRAFGLLRLEKKRLSKTRGHTKGILEHGWNKSVNSILLFKGFIWILNTYTNTSGELLTGFNYLRIAY